jgi:hypothetical protein
LIAKRRSALCGAAANVVFTVLGGTMNTLSRVELTGLARLSLLGGGALGRPEKSATNLIRPAYVILAAALIAGLAAWMLLPGYSSKPAESHAVLLAAAAEPAPSPVAAPKLHNSPADPPPPAGEAIVPEETAPVDGLKISSQSWRRGGLGSKALVTFTLRNGNDYAVKDIEIFCAFSRRDGSHLTDRIRMIHEIVNMKSRKTFARMHVGFVNVYASKAKCSPVAAQHI